MLAQADCTKTEGHTWIEVTTHVDLPERRFFCMYCAETKSEWPCDTRNQNEAPPHQKA